MNSTFAKNVEALKSVVPPALGQEEITARLGSGWIPPGVITEFIQALLPGYKGQVQYHEQLGAWTVANADHFTLQSVEATQTWGTGRRNAVQLIDDALNLRQPIELQEELGLQYFDAWAQMFTDTSQSVEMKPDGSGFRVHTRFNRFTNLPELAAIWRHSLPSSVLFQALVLGCHRIQALVLGCHRRESAWKKVDGD